MVEVSLALALTAFAMVTLLGALTVGLQAVRDSRSREIAANIARRLQASLQQISFADASSTSATTVATLAAQTNFYAEDGVDAADPAHPDPTLPPAFYKAVFEVEAPVFMDGSNSQTGTVFAQASNARAVTITLWYPQAGTTAGQQKFAYSFLVARQQVE